MPFTKDLTCLLRESLNTIWPEPPSNPLICVEIGSFEGRGSIVISQKLCSIPGSKLYCIDPFDDEYVKGNNKLAFWNYACKGQKEKFYHNTKNMANIIPLEGTSDTMIPSLLNNNVDFVYIDGDHSPEQVYLDAVNMIPKMKSGGIILFDDYGWIRNGIKTADGIDRFLKEYEGKYEILFKKYQLAIRWQDTSS